MMAGTGAALAMSAEATAPQLTAADIIGRIKAHVGVPWAEKTVDGIIAGDAKTPVTGIATVMMATLDSLKRAAAAKLNFVVTHEPTFWSHQEDVSTVQNDPLYLEKLAFIKEHKLVSFHFHDHWHALKPQDGIAVGMMRRLGWTAYADKDNPYTFTLPQTTLQDLAHTLRNKLNASTMRVIGDPKVAVRRVRTGWGYAMKAGGMQLLNSDADVVIIGETWEWELQEYANDLSASGRNKALIVLGHINSEQWGMQYCAEWLKTFVSEVPVEFLEMKEPYWAPPA
jgi:putative NIF3 family GTP cyclohydrolase 1 type 2